MHYRSVHLWLIGFALLAGSYVVQVTDLAASSSARTWTLGPATWAWLGNALFFLGIVTIGVALLGRVLDEVLNETLDEELDGILNEEELD